MKYYRLAKGSEVKYVALPEEGLLPVAEFVCFNPLYKKKGVHWLFTSVALSYVPLDGSEWDFDSLPETKYDTCVELSQEEYRKLTGDIYEADYYYRNENEPYYEGELPEDWEEQAQKVLLPDSSWCDHFGYEGDWCKVVDGEIDCYDAFVAMIDLMEGVDPELQLEAYDRWIYAHALVKLGKMNEVRVGSKFPKTSREMACELLEDDGFFYITSVHRDDLEGRGFDTSDVSDSDMRQLANKMSDDYCTQMFYESMESIAEIMGIPKREEDECEDE